MNTYSLQNECLENIEAFSDEQLIAEMNVIESVFAIYDKAILMMELANSDINIPDCSMFMESTFIQEVDDPPADNIAQQQASTPPSDANVKQQPNAQDQSNNGTGDQGQNNDTNTSTENNSISEEERKKYNSENPFRQKNKKGKVENIFISIIAFIPRLLGFLIQCGVKLFKKITNKDEKELDNTIESATDEEKQQVAEEIKKKEGTAEGDVKFENGKIEPNTEKSTDMKSTGETPSVSLTAGGRIYTGVDRLFTVTGESALNALHAIKAWFGNLTADKKTPVVYNINNKTDTPKEEVRVDITQITQKMENDIKNAKQQQAHEMSISDFDRTKMNLAGELKRFIAECSDLMKRARNLVNDLKQNAGKNDTGFLNDTINKRRQDIHHLYKFAKTMQGYLAELDKIDQEEKFEKVAWCKLLEACRKAQSTHVKGINQTVNQQQHIVDTYGNKNNTVNTSEPVAAGAAT